MWHVALFAFGFVAGFAGGVVAFLWVDSQAGDPKYWRDWW